MAGAVSRHGRRLLDDEYGATAPRRKCTARRLLDGKGRRNGSSMARDGVRRLLDGEERRATAPRWQGTARERRRWTESTTAMGGNGQQNGEWTVMDGAALQRWMSRRQLDGKERRDGDLTLMNDEERCKRDGDVDNSGGGSNKCQRVITLSNVVH